MEKENLTTTNNCLKDIITWLKLGSIVCIWTDIEHQYYYLTNTCDKMKDQNLIFVDVSTNPSLSLEYEWPWYIKDEGFVLYESITVLPTDPNKIYYFSL